MMNAMMYEVMYKSTNHGVKEFGQHQNFSSERGDH